MKKAKSGQGSLFYNNTLQRWQGQYKGKTIYQNLKEQETEKEFIRRFDKFKVDVDEDIYIKKNTSVLETIISNYIEQKFKDGKVSPRTYRRDLETFKMLKKVAPNLLKKNIQKITIDDIEKSKEKMRDYAQSSIDKMWIMLKKAFKQCYSRRIILFNIMETDIEKPISKKDLKIIRSLTIEEENKLRAALHNEISDYAKIAIIQLNRGMRAGELLSRKLNDFNSKNKTLNIHDTLTMDENYMPILGEHTKTYSRIRRIDFGKRTIPLDDESYIILNNIKNGHLKNIHSLFFWNYPKNELYTVGSYNSWLKRLNQKYRIVVNDDGTLGTLSSHMLRHTRITRMQEHHIPLVVIQYLVGHVKGSSITNDIYTDVDLNFAMKELENEEQA